MATEPTQPLSLAEMVAADAAAVKPSPVPPVDVTPPADNKTADDSTDDLDEPEPDEEPEPIADPPADDEEVTIRDYFKQRFPDRSKVADKYKDDDAFLDGINEMIGLMGKHSKAAEFLKHMQDAGVEPGDIERLIAEKSSPAKKTADVTDLEWDPDWVTTDEDGNWIPTAKGRMTPGINDRIKAYRIKMAEAMRNPKLWAEMVKPYLDTSDKNSEQKIQELAEQMATETLNRVRESWVETHRDIILGPDKLLTAVGAKVNEYLQDKEFYPGIKWEERADKALHISKLECDPRPTKRVAIPGSKRQPPVAPGTKTKLTDEQFCEKYPNPTILEFQAWAEKGILPER